MDPKHAPSHRTGPRPDVLALLEMPGAPQIQGKVKKVDHHVVSVEFTRAVAPLLPIARQCTVQFSSADLEKPMAARSRVILRRDDTDTITYDFQFSPLDGETLNAVFRRRTAARVKPTEVVAVSVRSAKSDATPVVNAVLNDISLSGVSLSIGTQGEAMLCTTDSVVLSFRLPNVDMPIEVVGLVRYRRMAGTMIRYGIEYDPKSTREYGKQEERIAAYMVKRKIESVQQTLGTRAA
jgi:c-di-GMP-binding flagellar brake protein YcgR